jgi:putative peptidoglycan lipid II flippase
MAAETRPTRGRGARDAPKRSRPGKIARNTLIFSIATGLSRIAGVVREIVASSYFGTSGAFSAFTLAFQIPNLVRSLVADSALSAAFVPVFTELLEERRRREAIQLASTLVVVIIGALGGLAALFMLVAPLLLPLITGGEFTPALDDLAANLTQVLFPIVVLLGINGLIVGILNAYDHFSIPALAPLVWNIVIVAVLVWLKPKFDGDDQMYAYAIAIVAGTAVQLAMSIAALRHVDFRFARSINLRDPRVRQVRKLMIPVTLGLGLINFDLLLNAVLASEVSDAAPRAIEAAFRIYMLPQGMFSVALATVMFPTLSRLAAHRDLDGLRTLTGSGMRQIFLLLIPAAAVTLALAVPITRLVYERGAFGPASTHAVATALFWFSFSLPFAGVNLLLTRTFFSLQRPRLPTRMAAASLGVNLIVSLALYKPLGIAGIVIGTGVASVAMTYGQLVYLRRELAGRLEGRFTLMIVVRIVAASILLAGVAVAIQAAAEAALGTALVAQLLAVGLAIGAGTAVYVKAVLVMRVPEAHQIWSLVSARARQA